MAKLDKAGRERLKNARLAVEEGMSPHDAIVHALKGVVDQARRNLLWKALTERIAQKPEIKRVQRTKSVAPRIFLGAYNHERKLLRGIPEQDR